MSVASIEPSSRAAKPTRRQARQPAFLSADKVPIQSVVRAFSVLEVLAGHPAGLRLADLSRLVGMHKATVFRLVRTMMLLG
ncbi:helix-turn-helix domain-containing protein [Reyranella sp.]|uniref:helix-turn-helix domain-containing protein n=1 Tax=Reyranella sp. TaxID=1929291 RepID=UPI0040360E3D